MTPRWLAAFESDLPRLVRDLEALVRLESPSEDSARVSCRRDPSVTMKMAMNSRPGSRKWGQCLYSCIYVK